MNIREEKIHPCVLNGGKALLRNRDDVRISDRAHQSKLLTSNKICSVMYSRLKLYKNSRKFPTEVSFFNSTTFKCKEAGRQTISWTHRQTERDGQANTYTYPHAHIHDDTILRFRNANLQRR